MINRTPLLGLAVTAVSVVLLGLTAIVNPAIAETLTGTVSSQKEGSMEGVLVNAKKQGSTIMVTVVSNAQGKYTFPGDRLSAGSYDITVRAVGYKNPATKVDISAGKNATLDLKLDEVTDKMELARQLSNAEWMISAGKDGGKLGTCVSCHTLQLPMFSKHNAEALAKVVQRMDYHTNNSSPTHPWFDEDVAVQLAKPLAESHISLGTYIATVNLNGRDTWPFELKTQPRPKGEDTQVIYTTYDLARPDAAPHDIAFDADGNVWYSDFTTQYIGKLDPKTGKVKDYEIPLHRANGIAQGGLQIDIDPEGKVWFGNMEQIQVVRFDPVTEKVMNMYRPIPVEGAGDARTTMIDPSGMGVDGNVWFNVAAAEEGVKGRGAWRLHVASGKLTQVTYPKDSLDAMAYDVVADSSNNLWGMRINSPYLWTTDAKELQTEFFPVPEDRTGCRRGHMDNQNRLWCGDYAGNGIVMFNTKTRKFEGNWTMPMMYTKPYAAHYDDKSYVWAGGMESDLVIRLNPQSGKINQFLVPGLSYNMRHVQVWKGKPDELSSLWIGDNNGAKLTHIEPLAP